MKTVSQDAIDKAFAALGIEKSESTEVLNAETTPVDETDEVEKGSKMKKDEEEETLPTTSKDDKKVDSDKKKTKKKDDDEPVEDEDEDVEKAIEAAELTLATLKAKKAEKEKPLEKAETTGPVVSDEIVKGINDKFDALTTINRRVLEKLNDVLSKQGEMQQDIDLVKGQTPGKKSLTGTKYIEKSFGDDLVKGNDDGTRTLSIKTHKRDILELMDASSFEGERIKDETMAKAMVNYETTNQMPANIMAAIQKDHKVRLVA